MGLGKQKPELRKNELFRRTEAATQDESPRQKTSPPVVTAGVDADKNPKERFSLYLDQETAKGLRVYAASHGIKNISGFITGLIGKFLEENN
ncbi:MAG: hypothetical protein AB7U63_09585 [Porticoccaceae bacterium]